MSNTQLSDLLALVIVIASTICITACIVNFRYASPQSRWLFGYIITASVFMGAVYGASIIRLYGAGEYVPELLSRPAVIVYIGSMLAAITQWSAPGRKV